MAKVYLDANCFIDLIEHRKSISLVQFQSHCLLLSPLSVHIYIYLYKQKSPNNKLTKLLEYFTLIPIDGEITRNSLTGPTADFEDNLQLHSSAASSCDFFLTNDISLLNLRFFGKTKIVRSLRVLT